ncbi:MAG: hypothetical protein Q8868_08695 [Bacteroidota bacterium]|nr:hypothetical protein [Bacteroidota bacterium]
MMTCGFSQRNLVSILSIILIVTFSCSTAKEVPKSETYSTAGWKNLYVFHAGDSTWIVKPVPVRGNQFSGQIFSPEKVRKHRNIQIYAEPLSSVTIRDGKISVPMENIVKVENFRISPGMVLLSAGVLALLFLVPVYL